jgi:5-methylcytosine-specific restriction endonuclease McrA
VSVGTAQSIRGNDQFQKGARLASLIVSENQLTYDPTAEYRSRQVSVTASRTMAKSSRSGKTRKHQAFYSEHVYNACSGVYGMLGDYEGGSIDDFIVVEKLLIPHRKCVLHDLISNTLDFFYGEMFYDFPDTELGAHRAVVREAGLSFPVEAERRILEGCETFDDKSAIYTVIAEATEKIQVPSVFHTLFSDRNFIVSLQRDLQHLLRTKGEAALQGRLTSRGTVRRTHLPRWLEKAIFFRDRGQCQICDRDISGLRSPLDEIHLDHIIPLAEYGNNDPTNFQLTCRECNLEKGTAMKFERARFVPYWREEKS